MIVLLVLIMPFENSRGDHAPLHSELAPIDQILVASANIIDLLGTRRDSRKGPLIDADWTDDENNLKFLLQSTQASNNGYCIQYDLFVYEQLGSDKYFERYRYDATLKYVEVFDENNKNVSNKRKRDDKLAQLAAYVGSAPVGSQDIDGTFEVIMAMNGIQDPRAIKKLRRFARRALRGFQP